MLDTNAAEDVLRELLAVDREYNSQEGRLIVGAQPSKREQIYDRIVRPMSYEKGSRFRLDDVTAPARVRSLLESGNAVVILSCPDASDQFEIWTRRW